MAALSTGAAAIHFAVVFEHFSEYTLYGAFFLILAWAQLVWPAVLIALPFLTWTAAKAQPARFPAGWSQSGLTPLAARRIAAWLWLGIAGNAGVLVIYFSSRSIGLPMTSSADSLQSGMGDMGSTNGLPDMRMYGSTKPPTAAQVAGGPRASQRPGHEP